MLIIIRVYDIISDASEIDDSDNEIIITTKDVFNRGNKDVLRRTLL